MIDTLRLTAEDALGLLERKEVSGAELHRAYLGAVAERARQLSAEVRAPDDVAPIAVEALVLEIIALAARFEDGRRRVRRGHLW